MVRLYCGEGCVKGPNWEVRRDVDQQEAVLESPTCDFDDEGNELELQTLKKSRGVRLGEEYCWNRLVECRQPFQSRKENKLREAGGEGF